MDRIENRIFKTTRIYRHIVSVGKRDLKPPLYTRHTKLLKAEQRLYLHIRAGFDNSRSNLTIRHLFHDSLCHFCLQPESSFHILVSCSTY